MRRSAIYALTPQGASLGKRINFDLDGDLFLPKRISESHEGRPFDRLKDIVAANFSLVKLARKFRAKAIVRDTSYVSIIGKYFIDQQE